MRLRSVLSSQGMRWTEQKQRDNTSLFPSLQTLLFVYEKHSTGIRSALASLDSAPGLPSRAARTVRAGILPNFLKNGSMLPLSKTHPSFDISFDMFTLSNDQRRVEDCRCRYRRGQHLPLGRRRRHVGFSFFPLVRTEENESPFISSCSSLYSFSTCGLASTLVLK